MLKNLFLIKIVIKKFDIIIFIIFLMRLLVKIKFCNVMGYFISKLVWVNFFDFYIFDWFLCICRNFFYYYNGFVKKKSFY